METKEPLDNMVDDLYAAFARYEDSGGEFCSHCHSEAEIQRIKQEPLRDLSADDARVLLWEPSDHWPSQDVYRHYLPRMLEAMGPPLWVEDMYVEHFFETVRALAFPFWNPVERNAVTGYLRELAPLLKFKASDERDAFFKQIESLVELPNAAAADR